MADLPAGSPLFHRTMTAEDLDADRLAFMLQVWSGTPWMIDAPTGRVESDRFREIMEWCRDRFGPEAWPLHGRPGHWQRGGATINGETWLGFSTEAQMREFVAEWGDVAHG